MDKREAYPTRNEQDAARGCGVAANAGLWRKNPGDYTAKEHGAEAEDGSGQPARCESNGMSPPPHQHRPHGLWRRDRYRRTGAGDTRAGDTSADQDGQAGVAFGEKLVGPNLPGASEAARISRGLTDRKSGVEGSVNLG